METTRTPLRSIHPTKPVRRPRLMPGWRHSFLYSLQYFQNVKPTQNPADLWSTSFPWSVNKNE